MARVKIDLPASFHFETGLRVQIGDLNYGGHVGNDVFLRLLHEVRMRFLKENNFSELDVCGAGLIMSDAALVYKAQAYYGMRLTARLAVADFSRVGCDFFYRLTDDENNREILRAKTGMVFFDYQKNKVVNVPGCFKTFIAILSDKKEKKKQR